MKDLWMCGWEGFCDFITSESGDFDGDMRDVVDFIPHLKENIFQIQFKYKFSNIF